MFFLEPSCFFHDPVDVGNLISGSSAFSKTSLNIWKFTAHVLLKPGLENFEHYFASVWDECNCAIVCVSISLHYSECRQKQTWIFIRRTDAEAEAPILWPPDVKSGLTGKNTNAGTLKARGEGATEDEMIRHRHRLSGHEFEQTLGDGEAQGSLACCSPRGHKEPGMA